MNKTNLSGPAFSHEVTSMTHSGMTLRDYFAAKAMQADMTDDCARESEFTELAARAYKMADAMLKAREA